MPEISILMPVWNGCRDGKETYLIQAIESILDQTFTDFEFIIVDDGSTDNTQAVLAFYEKKDQRIRIFRNDTNQKIVRSLNRGLSMCKAPLVARMDADDISTVTRLQIQKEFLDNRPETVMCGTRMYVINSEGKLEFESTHPCAYSSVRDFLKRGCAFVHGSVMFRKSAIDALSGYSADPQYEYAEDYELWVRLAASNVVENIPDRTLYFHRNHGSKSSFTFRDQQSRATNAVINKAQQLLK